MKPSGTSSLTLALTATRFYFIFISYHLLTHWLHTYLRVCPALSLLSLLQGNILVVLDIWACVVTVRNAAVLNFCFYFCICDRLVSRWEKFSLSSLLNFKHFVGHRCRSWHGFCLQGVSPTKPEGERPGDFCFPAMHPTAALPANLLIFAARMQEVSGAVTLRQVPEAHKKRNTHTHTHVHQLHHHHHTVKHSFNNLSTHWQRTQKCKDTSSRSVIPRAVVLFQPF